MAKKSAEAVDASDREIVFTRTFDAPRELVWRAWTDPKQVVQWLGPNGFTTTMETMEVRPGGKWHYVMHGPDGTDYLNKSIFIEVVENERLVYQHGGRKEGELSAQFESTITFEALAGGAKTKLTLRMVFPTAEVREQVIKVYKADEGGVQTLERLREYLKTVKA